MKPTKGFMLRVSGEYLKGLLKIPEDVHILKITHTDSRDYSFDIVCVGETGWDMAEGGAFALDTKGRFRDKE